MKTKHVVALVSTLAALAAVTALFLLVNADLDDVLSELRGLGGGAFVLVCLASVIQIGLSAYKWHMLLAMSERPAGQTPTLRLSFLLASLAAVAAQFVPLLIAAPSLRGLVARFTSGVPIAEGALASAVEQAFDVAAFLMFLVPSLAVLVLLSVGFEAEPILWVMIAVLAYGTAFQLLGDRVTVLARRLQRFVGSSGRAGEAIEAVALVSPPVQRQLLILSTLRYGVMFLRAVVVASAITLSFPVMDLLLGYSFVQASQLLSATPGNLGFAEWTWVGVLGALGHGLGAIAVFSVTLRVISVASFVVTLLIAGLCMVPTTLASPRPKPR